MKDTDLKVFEQTKEIAILKKKLRALKEKELKVIDIELKLEEVVKKVNEASENQMLRNKCSECDYVAKSDEVLKVHFKAKHTEPQKFKCCTCDFSCATKIELTAHNDIYYDSHRMKFYPEKKKYYLEEIEQMKNDGFTVKEGFYKDVLKCDN